MGDAPSPYREDNDEVLNALKEAYLKRNPGIQTGIKLPEYVHFNLGKDYCEIIMGKDQDGKDQVAKNMQDNEAAFEGWALALHAWLDCGVVLSWEPPTDPDPRESRHYQRFLYRVIHLEPVDRWFEVKDECKELLSDSLVYDAVREEKLGSFVMNEPLEGRTLDSVPLEERDDEKKIEFSFCENEHDRESLVSCMGLGSNPKIFRQVPVGLFSEKLGDGKPRVFPGGASMIDLAASDEDHTVAIFELKYVKSDRYPMIGAISELLFYSHFIRDAQKGIFVYPSISDKSEKRLLDPERDKTSDRVKAYVLTNNLHPLLNSIKVFDTLNEVYSPLQEFGFISYEGPVDSITCQREEWIES